jgi:hypothetical protein
MPQDRKYQIILLPQRDYWKWVDAVRDYVGRFGASVTPSPDKALAFHHPEQVISVVSIPGGYPQHGNVVDWLRRQSAQVSLDVLAAQTPERLRQALAERVAGGLQFGRRASIRQPSGEFSLLWPTDYPAKTQGFGENPNLYRRWSLPGHEGVDFKAPINSQVYACADGEVYLVHDGSGNHPYGIHIRILHQEGYRTVYGHLNKALVGTGQFVRAGEVIGLADGTGNSVGNHLHLTLKKDGATAAGLTPYPFDIIDPTPFLIPVTGRQPSAPADESWPYDHCLVGLVGRAGGPMQEADWQVTRTAHIEALALSIASMPADVERALSDDPSMFLLGRLAVSVQSRTLQPADFFRLVEYSVRRLYDGGVRFFEIHNEPNLMPEGYGAGWRSGREFGEWFLQVVGMMRPAFPEARFGWPGLSPGPSIEGMRLDHRLFLEDARNEIRQADWIGCHCYWQDEAGMLSDEGGLGYQLYRSLWPDKLLLITEFSNVTADLDGHAKGNQYLKYYSHLRNQPGVGAAFAFAASSATHPGEVWRSEEGLVSPIAGIVGARPF